MDKIIKVVFDSESTVRIRTGLSSEDYGLILQVEGLTLPDGNIEVHFSLTEHDGDAPAYIGTVKDNVITIDIPDFIFQKENVYDRPSYEAYAFIYQTDGESGRTIKKIAFTIQTRPKSTTEVPEDQKDQFLQEVRQVLTETKGIAQSVREDADNGEFNGEQGPQGPPGVIKYIPVTELPTENIQNAIYLLKRSDAEDGNLYDEYIYTNGVWELIGSKPIKLDLSNYVTFDDMASQSKPGLVKTYTAGGTGMDSQKRLVILVASEDEIKNRTTAKKVITPSNMDLAIQEGLTNSQIEWTDEQIQAFKTFFGLIGLTDYPDGDNAGVVKVSNYSSGLVMSQGSLLVSPATKINIDAKTDARKPIVSKMLDYAVMKALTDPLKHEWTDEQKKAVRDLLGLTEILESLGYVDGGSEQSGMKCYHCGKDIASDELYYTVIDEGAGDATFYFCEDCYCTETRDCPSCGSAYTYSELGYMDGDWKFPCCD